MLYPVLQESPAPRTDLPPGLTHPQEWPTPRTDLPLQVMGVPDAWALVWPPLTHLSLFWCDVGLLFLQLEGQRFRRNLASIRDFLVIICQWKKNTICPFKFTWDFCDQWRKHQQRGGRVLRHWVAPFLRGSRCQGAGQSFYTSFMLKKIIKSILRPRSRVERPFRVVHVSSPLSLSILFFLLEGPLHPDCGLGTSPPLETRCGRVTAQP